MRGNPSPPMNCGRCMPKNLPSLKPRELIRLLESADCQFYREGRGDHRLYVRYVADKKRVVPIDMGVREFSPVYGTTALNRDIMNTTWRRAPASVSTACRVVLVESKAAAAP